MHEASKALMRRLHDNRFSTRYFVGNGIDIGCGPDSIAQYVEQFPQMRNVKIGICPTVTRNYWLQLLIIAWILFILAIA